MKHIPGQHIDGATMYIDTGKATTPLGGMKISVVLKHDGTGHVECVATSERKLMLLAFAGGSWPQLVEAVNNADVIVKQLQAEGRLTAFRFS